MSSKAALIGIAVLLTALAIICFAEENHALPGVRVQEAVFRYVLKRNDESPLKRPVVCLCLGSPSSFKDPEPSILKRLSKQCATLRSMSSCPLKRLENWNVSIPMEDGHDGVIFCIEGYVQKGTDLMVFGRYRGFGGESVHMFVLQKTKGEWRVNSSEMVEVACSG